MRHRDTDADTNNDDDTLAEPQPQDPIQQSGEDAAEDTSEDIPWRTN